MYATAYSTKAVEMAVQSALESANDYTTENNVTGTLEKGFGK
jgi:hypothetical protein